jgi:hypothetical protein
VTDETDDKQPGRSRATHKERHDLILGLAKRCFYGQAAAQEGLSLPVFSVCGLVGYPICGLRPLQGAERTGAATSLALLQRRQNNCLFFYYSRIFGGLSSFLSTHFIISPVWYMACVPVLYELVEMGMANCVG